MSNEDRLPPRRELVEYFGRGFIQDTYSTAANADGYEDDFFGYDFNEMGEGYDLPWRERISAGSIAAQYLEMLWFVHRDDFWAWRFEEI